MRIDKNYYTPNASYMGIGSVRTEVARGIDNPSHSLINFGRALYRVSTATYKDRTSGAIVPASADTGYKSNWWATQDDFLNETWFSTNPSLSAAGRKAYAIHPAWHTDCRNVTVIRLKIDLACWYGLARAISDKDPDTGLPLTMTGSPNTLQIYIPGFKDNYEKWAELGGTIPFGS